MKRSVSLVAATVLALGIFAPAAVADERRPPDLSVTVNNLVADPTVCGSYGVEWDIHLTLDRWDFRDDQGRLVKRVEHIVEDNTVKNTVTGLTLRDGPVDFRQVSHYNPETGLRETIKITGISVNVVRGDQRLIDKGPILIHGQTGEILRSAGPHPVRELLDGSFDISLALPAFCDILG